MNNRLLFYRLDDNLEPVSCTSTEVEVGKTLKKSHVGDYYVSTVFLGFDHNFSGSGLPLLFETMVFRIGQVEISDVWDNWQKRDVSWNEALEIHDAVVARLQLAMGNYPQLSIEE